MYLIPPDMQNTPYMSGLNEGSQNSDTSVVSCKGKKIFTGFSFWRS